MRKTSQDYQIYIKLNDNLPKMVIQIWIYLKIPPESVCPCCTNDQFSKFTASVNYYK